MTALKDQWQEQKRQRQEELAQRQHQVREILASHQQERQIKASQLRDDLSLFQLELQQETQDFLVRVNKQRQTQAKQVAHLLRNFTQVLQAQTAEFLAAKAADRAVVARQLAQDLSRFHSELSASVTALRAELQVRMRSLKAEVQAIQAETQTCLSINHQHRLQVQQQQAQDLAAFITSLQSQVQDYLIELELLRQDRAQQLHRMLQQHRDRRLSEVNALFQQLSEFRGELRQYRADLSKLVWDQVPAQPIAAPVAPSPVAPAQKAPTQPVQRQTPAPISQPLVAPTMATMTATATRASAPDAPTEILDRAFIEATIQTVQETQPVSDQLEKEIYNHIHQIQGARLTEIESALGINRFQTVDALRSLIKKGLITQRDRVYLIQEEVSL